MSIELKIKSKHLATEPAIIRHEERKLLNIARRREYNDTESILVKYRSLSEHRKWVVRNESRATYLARAFLSGKPYSSVEKKVHNYATLRAHIMPRIVDMVMKYGPDNVQKVYNRENKNWEYPKDVREKYKSMVLAWIDLPY
jgi:hypothetical protein